MRIKHILFIFLFISSFINADDQEIMLWKAKVYDENSRLQFKITENFLTILHNRFNLDLPAHAQLLDVGCGTGRNTELLIRMFPRVTIKGIDASKEMIDFANQLYANSQTDFSLDRAEELKTVGSESIDALTSFSCLHWVHNLPKAFHAMHRVLKRGGWIALMFAADTGYDDPIDRAYAQAIQENPWKPFFTDIQPEVNWNLVEPIYVKSHLEELGFQVMWMEAQNYDYVFQDFNAFRAWILACFQQLKLLPEELQSSCAHRIASLYLESTNDWQSKGTECMYRVDALMLFGIKPFK